MVDRRLVRELLLGVRKNLLNERLAHAMSKAAAETPFAFDLAALIEGHVRGVVAIPECGGLDLVVLPEASVQHGSNGMLHAPTPWPPRTVALELKEVRLANGIETAGGYDETLSELRSAMAEKMATPRSAGADWVALSLMTDGAPSETVKREAERVARDVRVERWRPCPEGLLCIGSTFRSVAYREWRANVWVEAFAPTPANLAIPLRTAVERRPPERFVPDGEALAWYATHGADGDELDGDAHGAAHLRVEATALHEYRCDQYERLGRWGGTFEELRLCLFQEHNLWRKVGDDSSFDAVPGVSQLVDELRRAWVAPR